METPKKKEIQMAEKATPTTPESHALFNKKKSKLGVAEKKEGGAAEPKKKKKVIENHFVENENNFFSFPLYELTGSDDLVFVGGGGGAVSSGVPNMWGLFRWENDNLTKLRLENFDSHIVTNGCLHAGSRVVGVGKGRELHLFQLPKKHDQPLEKAVVYETEEAGGEDEDVEQKCCHVDPSGTYMAAGGSEGNLIIVDIKAGKILHKHKTDFPISKICMKKNGKDKTTVVLLSPLKVQVGWFSAAEVSFSAAVELSTLHDGRGAQFRGVTFAGDSLVVGIVSRGSKASYFATFSGSKSFGKFEGLFKTTAEPQTCIAASADGKLVASGTADGSVTVFGLDKHKFHRVMKTSPHTFFVSSVMFSPDGSHVLSSSGDRSLMIQKVRGEPNYAMWILIISLIVLLLAIYLK